MMKSLFIYLPTAICAICVICGSAFSQPIPANTPPQPFSLTAAWNGYAEEEYEVEWTDDTNHFEGYILTDTSSITITNLIADNYFFRIAAVNQFGLSSAFTPWLSWPAPTNPGTNVFIFTANILSSTSLLGSWSVFTNVSWSITNSLFVVPAGSRFFRPGAITITTIHQSNNPLTQ